MSQDYTPLQQDSLREQQGLIPLVPKFVSRFLGHDEREDAFETAPPISPCKTFTLCPEAFRFTAYMFFIFMCLFAMFLTSTSVASRNSPENLASCDDGTPSDYKPEKECDSEVAIPRRSCPVPGVPPFSGHFDGVDRAHGFDILHSHLMEAFGFNNICVNWDYTPSREWTAMVYPLFEFSLLLYVVLNYVNITLHKMQSNAISHWFYVFSHVSFYVQIVFCAMFRMIFVIIAYEDVRGHTAGFLALQFSLMLVTISNAVYVLNVSRAYGAASGPERMLYWGYLVGNMVIGVIKIYLTSYVVFGLGLPYRIYPCWAKSEALFGMKWGQLVDRVWMIFNVICPIIISLIRLRVEPKLVIRIHLKHSDYIRTV